MKKTLVLAIVAGMLLTGAANVEGDVYYVSDYGSGSGDGSSYENSMSVAVHSNSSFSPGDTIYLVDTIAIASRVIIPSSGIEGEGNRIVYRGDYPGHPGVLSVSGGNPVLDLHGEDYLIFDGIEISNGRNGIGRTTGTSSYITIKNCKIHNLSERGILLGDSDHITIGGAPGEGNEIYDCGGDTAGGDVALGYSINNVTISYNDLRGDGSTGVDGVVTEGSGPDIIIEYNKIHNHYREDGVDIKRSNGVIVRFNEIYGHNRQTGITVQMDSYNVKIHGNRIHDNSNGIWMRDFASGGSYTNDIHIWSNLIYHNDNNGIVANHRSEWDMGVKDVYIYNNVIAENGNNPASDYEIGLYINAGSNWHIENNIFYKNRPNDSTYNYRQVYIESGQTSSTTLDYNRYYYSGVVTPKVYWGSSGWKTVAELKNISKELNGSEGDPGFNDIGNADYTLAAYSACIDAGADLGTDYAWGLDPLNTDFSTFPPTVQTASQNDYGAGWETGAYVFAGVAYLPIDQAGWELEHVDSEELVEDDGYPAEKSFDGDPDTFWSTQWTPTSPAHPHEIQIDLGGFYDICGFRYLPRQDDGPGDENGMIDEYEFYVSSDGSDWETAVAAGTLVKDKTEKQVSFDNTLGQYVRLIALSEVNGNPWTTMAELNVLAVQPDSDINDDGKINIEDFAVLACWWDDENACSSPGWCGGGDFDMSGTVDMLDLAYFAENWLR